MAFGVMVGWIRQVLRTDNCPRQGVILGVDVGIPLQSMGSLWHICTKVHKPIELLFWMVSGVGPGIALDGGPHPSRRRGGFVSFSGPLV